jgi:hypothetical protein
MWDEWLKEGAEMRHAPRIREPGFTLEFEHDDSSPWHVAQAGEDHDHAVAILLGGSATVTIESAPATDSFTPTLEARPSLGSFRP